MKIYSNKGFMPIKPTGIEKGKDFKLDGEKRVSKGRTERMNRRYRQHQLTGVLVKVND